MARLAFVGLMAASGAFAAPDEPDYAQLRQAKLASPFLAAAPWRLDYDAARREAAESGRPIFAYFTASYFH
jgi:hypothetical protein